MAEENEARKPRLLAPVKPAPNPVTRSGVDLRDPERLNRVLDELDSLPGLESVASQVRTLANRVRLNEERKTRGLRVSEVGMHAVFVGPPGTGKTTVARVRGRMLAATGLLPSGHVIETDRSGLVAQYQGHTAQKTGRVIDSAKGGVLFIDEAYSLTPPGPASNDFGSEAVDTLLKRMEDDRSEFCVIVAGYTREMERFLESNTGLRSRFAQTVTFPNYGAEALQSILESMVARDDYRIAAEAEALLAVRSLGLLPPLPPTGRTPAACVAS
ncbi:AAA family ATPase [Kytococcus schroeteri]|uniref:AAA family ATPase n=1 Tax=Kytococcus schroeteri TaxID=138300 RepID=UPI0015DEB43E|nr:AAA family ATPase [Kytococcus schroeteri]